MLGKSILYVKEDAVAWVTLNRPQAQNRLDLCMCNEIRDVCQAIAQDDEVRLAVITGAGDTFCGGDEEEPSTLSDGDSAERIRERLEPRRVAAFIGAIEKPTIAGINGDALGHGLGDSPGLRYSSRRRGRQLRHDTDMRWDYPLGRRHPAAAPHSGAGLGNGYAPERKGNGLRGSAADWPGAPGATVRRPGRPLRQMASTMAALAPIATRYAKETVLKGMDMTLEQGMRLEMDLNLILQTTRDRAEGIASFLEKREPTYTGE